MFTPGKIVILENPKANKKHLTFKQLNKFIQKKGFDCLLILKTVDEDYSLVARCLRSRKPGDWYYTIKIDGQKYRVAVRQFIKVPNCILVSRDISLDNHNEVIDKIFTEQKNFYKNKEISPKRKREIELSKKYYSVYQTAVINNDLQTLNKLKTILGKDPTVFFSGNRTAKEKSAKLVSDNVFKPFQGGSFSPN